MAHALRRGCYRLVPVAAEGDKAYHRSQGSVDLSAKASDGSPPAPGPRAVAIETERGAARKVSDRLVNVPGLSFSFSASGWLFVYELGVAECLQNHGIARSPHVRVSGASGGALTAATMMYGCSMPALRDIIKEAAKKTHKDVSQGGNLRAFVLEACKSVVKDGSHLHPAFQEGRVQICFSATECTDKSIVRNALRGRVTLDRCHQFDSSAEVVIALLASATMGISGLPFLLRKKDGKTVKVADAAVSDFLPAVDEFSVRIKPFSDATLMIGGMPDVHPTEFVPGVWGLFPPSAEALDHLYELGYQDMEAWLETNLQGRVDQIRKKAGGNELPPELPPVSFRCEDDGMMWFEEVTRRVPVQWSEMMKAQKDFEREAWAKPIWAGELLVRTFSIEEKNHGAGHDRGSRCTFTVTGEDLQWVDVASAEGDDAELSRQQRPLTWVEHLVLDPKDAVKLSVYTCNAAQMELIADTPADAKALKDAIDLAVRNRMQTVEAEQLMELERSGVKQTESCAVS